MSIPFLSRFFEASPETTPYRDFNINMMGNLREELVQNRDTPEAISIINQVELAENEVIRLTEQDISELRSLIETKHFTEFQNILRGKKIRKDTIRELARLGVDQLKDRIPGYKQFQNLPPAAKWILGGLAGIGLSLGAGILGIFDWVASKFGYKGFGEASNFLTRIKNIIRGKGDTGGPGESPGSRPGESREGRGLLVGGGSILGAIAGSTILGKFLPKLSPHIGVPTQRQFLTKCATSFFLRGFGVGGIMLYGMGVVSEMLESSAFKSTHGEMPSDPDRQKSYLQAAIEQSSLDANTKKVLLNFAGTLNSGVSALTGETLDRYLDAHKEQPPEGFVSLEEKMRPLFERGNDFLLDCKKLGDNLKIPLIIGAIKSETIRRISWALANVGIKGALIIGGLLGDNIVKTLFIIMAICNGATAAGHMVFVPEDPNEFKKWLSDVLHGRKYHLPPELAQEAEVLADIERNIPEEHIDKLAQCVQDPRKIDTLVQTELDKAKKKAGNVFVDVLAPEEQQVLLDRTERGFKWFVDEVSTMHSSTDKEKKVAEYAREIIASLKTGQRVTEVQLNKLRELTREAGTRIRIVLHNTNVIGWKIQKGTNELEYETGYLCVNPRVTDQNKAYHIARKLPINREGGWGLIGAFFDEGLWGKIQSLGTEIREAIEKNNIPETASLTEKIIKNGGTFVYHLGKFILVDGLGRTIIMPATFSLDIFKLCKGEINAQEFVVETADGLAPIIVFGEVANILRGKRCGFFRSIFVEAPKLIFSIWKKEFQLGRSMFKNIWNGRFEAHNLAHIVQMKNIAFWSGARSSLGRLASAGLRLGSLNGYVNSIRSNTRDLSDLERINGLIAQAKAAGKKGITADIIGGEEYYLKRAREELSRICMKRGTNPAKLRGLNNIDLSSVAHAERDIGMHMGVLKTSVRLTRARLVPSLTNITRAFGHMRMPNIRSPKFRGRMGIAALIISIVGPLAVGSATSAMNEQLVNVRDTGWLEGNDDMQNMDDNGTDEIPENNESPEVGTTLGSSASPQESTRPQTVKKMLDSIQDKQNEKLAAIEGVENVFSFDQEWYRNHNEDQLKSVIDRYYAVYEETYAQTKTIAQGPKKAELIEYIKRESPDGSKFLQVSLGNFGIAGNIGLGYKDNKFSLKYQSKERIQRGYWELFDLIKDGYAVDANGNPTGWARTQQFGIGLCPIWGSLSYTGQAFRDFRRGNTSAGTINAIGAGLSWIGDATLIFGVGYGIKAAAVGIREGTVVGLRTMMEAYNATKAIKGIQAVKAASHTIRLGGFTGTGMADAHELSKLFDKEDIIN